MKARRYLTREGYWQIIVPARLNGGKKQRKYFKSKELAEAEIAKLSQRGLLGQRLQLDDNEAASIQLAREELGGSLKLLLEAARHYRLTVLSVTKQAHLEELIEIFLQRQEHERKALRTLDDDRQRLGRFYEKIGDIDVRQITEQTFRQYIDSHPPGGNRKSHYKAVKKFLRWAHQSGYLALDVTDRVKSVDKWKSNKDIIDTEDYRRLLFVCAGLEASKAGLERTSRYVQLLPYFVLGGLCGMRRSEILRDRRNEQILAWEDINWARNLIIVPHEVAKETPAQDRRRYIPLEPAAKEWLQLVAGTSGPIVDIYQSRHTQLCRELFSLLGFRLPKNGLRNSYASYAQTFRSPGDVAKACGDLEQTIRRFYTQALEPDEGKAWFDIRPSSSPKIISLAVSAAAIA